MATTFTKKESPYSHWEVLDIELGNRLRVVPECGGLITEWRSNGHEVLYFDLERFSQKGKSIRGGIPLLFPICGNLPGNSLPLGNDNFTLNQHGFARDSNWQLKFINDDDSVLLSLFDNKSTRAAYPYSFLIEIQIKLAKNSLDFKINIQTFVR